MALPKPHRLTQTKEFSKVYRFGKQAKTEHIAVRVMQLTGNLASDDIRLGITVSQKVSKRAVTRNRLKRQVGSAFQALLPKLKRGAWIVVVLRSASIQCDYWQFLRELEQLFLELEVFHGY